MPTPQSLANQMNVASDSLQVRCEACGHQTLYVRADAWRIWGMGATPHSIRRRAKCVPCGERGRIDVSII